MTNKDFAKLYLKNMGLSCMVEALIKLKDDVYQVVLFGGVVYDLYIGNAPQDYECALDCNGTVVYQSLHRR